VYNPNAPLTLAMAPLYFERGYTGHEHLEKFELINMNGRIYDPTICRMLSVDNYNNDVSSTIGMNRYAYAFNNPLKYTDPDGNWAIIDDIIAGAIGGVVNWASNGFQFNAKGLGYFGAGFAAGDLALYGPAGWAAGGAILGASNAALGGGNSNQIIQGAFVGAFSGLAGGAAGQYAAQGLGGLVINGFNVTSPIAKGIIGGAIGGAAGGYVGGFTGGLITTGDVGAANQAGLHGALTGAAIGAGAGGIAAYRQAVKNDVNPWTGRSDNSVTIGEGMTSNAAKGRMGVDQISNDLGSGRFNPKNLPAESWNTDGALMQENADWIELKMEMNSVIYDRGPVGNNSQYYNMEMGRTMDYQNLYNVRSYYNQSQTIRILIIHK
jgi:RHS repeat-associated protein